MRHSLSLWQNHTSPLFGFHNEFDRLFDGLLVKNRDMKDRGDFLAESFVPSCEVSEAGNHYLVSLEMPGVAKKDIHLEIYNNELVISGERRSQKILESDSENINSGESTATKGVKQSDQDGTVYSEMRFGKFERRFKIPVGIEINRVEASYQDGILRVKIPKVESAHPQQIKITDGLNENSLN